MNRSSDRRILAIGLGLALSIADEMPAQDAGRSNASPGVPEEECLELIDDEEAAMIAAERFSWFRENPVDLNRAQRDELLCIPGMTGEAADTILSIRERKGRLSSVQEIAGMPGGEQIFARVSPFVFVFPSHLTSTSGGTPALAFSSRLAGLVPASTSSSTPVAIGGSLKSLSRLAVNPTRNLAVGLLFEKDAGESPHDGFASGYICYRGSGVLEQAVVGDFTVEAGHGLVLWRGSEMGRNGDVAGGIRNSGGRIQPYHVADEFHYLRGGAIALKARPWTIPMRCLLFFSRTSLAATIDDQGVVTSFYTSGLFRTAAESGKRNGVHELLMGARLEGGVHKRAAIGLTYYHSTFDRMVKPSTTFGFSGRRLEVGGGDFSLTLRNVTLFGECARTAEGSTAWVTGAAIKLDSTVSANITWRDYPKGFHNPHAGGYGIQTNTSNERGITLGWSVLLARGLALHGYADQCKIPSSTYTSLLPRTASDFLIELTALPMTGMRLSLAFRKRRTEFMQQTVGSAFGMASVQDYRDRVGLRLTGRVAISSNLDSRLRIEHVVFRLAGSRTEGNGGMASQTLGWNVAGMECECGVVFFDTDAYDARLYDYEANVRGFVQSPPLFGRGSRWHVVASWNPLRWVRLAGKYAVMLAERNPVARELAIQCEVHL
jgi:hypothetical protein